MQPEKAIFRVLLLHVRHLSGTHEERAKGRHESAGAIDADRLHGSFLRWLRDVWGEDSNLRTP